jgi:tripartite-type tricarboxylate transporter receptor subunit TctC
MRCDTLLRLPLLLVSLLLGLTGPAYPQDDVANFYRGKQVRLIVGTAPGGGYDLFARIVARHMAAHIPGQPTVIVQNLPAAGGLVMTNQLYAVGPKDGTAIGVPINGIPTAPLLQQGAQFDATRLIWIGSTNREPYVAFVWHSAPVQSLAELRAKELVVGSTTPGTTMTDFPLVVNDILGLKFRVVRGYEGTPQINHAIERGEIQGQGGIGWAAIKAQVPQWIAEKKIKVIAQYGLKRHPELADVPSMLEQARTEPDRQALTMLFARTEYGRPYFLPPDVPAERVRALRRAFDATMRDQAFIADAARLQLEIDPMTGEEVQALVAQLARTPPEIVTRVRAALEAPAAR